MQDSRGSSAPEGCAATSLARLLLFVLPEVGELDARMLLDNDFILLMIVEQREDFCMIFQSLRRPFAFSQS